MSLEQRIEFKILLYTHKIVNSMAPVYLQELLDFYIPGRSLKLRKNATSKDTIVQFKIVWVQSIFYMCPHPPPPPQLWNALPLELRMCDSEGSFKKGLKTFLFVKAYW